MSSSVYNVNKNINKPIEFHGIKAQYILYLGLGLVGLLILFSILYVVGMPMYYCAIITGILGYCLFAWVMRYSHQYGEYGLMKELGYRRLPHSLHCPGRHIFYSLAIKNT